MVEFMSRVSVVVVVGVCVTLRSVSVVWVVVGEVSVFDGAELRLGSVDWVVVVVVAVAFGSVVLPGVVALGFAVVLGVLVWAASGAARAAAISAARVTDVRFMFEILSQSTALEVRPAASGSGTTRMSNVGAMHHLAGTIG